MKLKTLAVAVALTAAGSQAFATELYNQNGGTLEMGGRAEARLSVKDGEGADKSRVRLNFLGKQEINSNGLYGVGFWEGEFTAAGDEIDNRYVYAGMGGKFGEITYGKNDGALQVLTDFTDIMSYHGGSQAIITEGLLPLAYRADNMLSYKGQFDNLGLKASYRFEGQGNEEGNGTDGYSLSGTYAFADTGFEVGAGYADQEDMDEYMIVAGYTIGNFYMAGNFTGGDFQDSDYEAFELAAAYTMNKTVFSASYNNADVENDEIVDALAIDVTYYFKPNFRGYASYNFDLLDNDDVEDQDELALGLRYDF
ncbi:porin [Vibrio sagamiensis]|nr:porin [Vibrio sagamiensis]PNQ54398.1 porin [Vibrio agarivorans]